MRVFTFDTTLRDGTQGEAVSLSADDKVLVAHRLDELGIDYIEGGWPGSNPKDKDFFARAKSIKFKHARLTAFGATRMARNPVEEDSSVNALIEADTPVVCIFGKTWELHVRKALGITEEENLKLISDTVRYLKAHGKEVIYDAEHFFDGYKHSRDFAFRTLEAAHKAGADTMTLCDTNGGTMTDQLAQICADVRKSFDGILGIHTHNDCELAVANALAAVEQGIQHVQGLLQRLRRTLRQRQFDHHHRQPRIEDGTHHHRQRAADSIDIGGALYRGAGEPSAARGSGLCGPQRFRAQGWRTRERGA